MFRISNSLSAPALLIAVFLLLIIGHTLLLDIALIPETAVQTAGTDPDIVLPKSDASFFGNGNKIEYNGKTYQADKFFIMLIIINLVAFILPAVFYMRLSGRLPLSGMYMSFPKLRYLSFIISLTVALLSGVMLLSLAFPFMGEKIELYPIGQGAGVLLNGGIILTFAFLPAIAEEFVFRSVMLNQYRQYGIFPMAFVSAAGFAMSHFSVARLPVYMFAGLIFAVAAAVTKSVLYPVLMHAGFNFFGLYVQKNLVNVFRIEQNKYIFLFTLAVIFIVFTITALASLENIYYKKAYRNEPSPVKGPNLLKPGEAALKVVLSPTFLALIVIFMIYANLTR